MASAAEAVPALLPHLPVALEGLDSRMVDVVRTRRGPAAVPDLPRGGGWLFAETAGDTLEEARAAAGKLVADGGCLDSAVITGPAAAALWRIREDGAGLGRPDAGRGARLAGLGGLGRAARVAPRLPAGTRGAYGRARPRRPALRALRRRLHPRRIDFPLRDRPSVLRSFTQDAARLAASYGGSASGEHGDGRARGELLPAMYSASAIGLFGAVKQLFDPAEPAQSGRDRRSGPARRRPAGPARRAAAARPRRSPTPPTAATSRPPCTAAPASASAGPTTPPPAASCARPTWRPGTRRTPPGAARGSCRSSANGSLVSSGWQSPEVAEALDLCLSCKGCSTDCPAGVDMATYKAEALYQRYRRQAPARVALRARLAAPLGGADVAETVDGEAGQRRPAVRAGRRRGQALRRHRRAPGPARVRDPELPPLVRRAPRTAPSTAASPPPARAAVGGHVHQRLRAAGRPGRGRGPRGGRLSRCGSPRATSAAASPGSRPASWTGPGGSSSGRSTNSARPSTRASRSSGSSRRAPPRSAPTRPNCCRTTPAPRRSPPP